MKKFFLLSAIAALPMFADPCPVANGPLADALYTSATSPGNGCNVIITFNANGSITTTVPNGNPYDGTEDTLVGVVNNTGSAISSFVLVGTDPLTPQLFAFEGDGACDGLGDYESLSACTGATDPTGYGGPGVTFTGINTDPSGSTPAVPACTLATSCTTGTVNFAPGIAANGGTAWFSLEEPPSLNLTVSAPTTTSTPEPSSLWLLVAALGLAVPLKKLVPTRGTR